MINIKRNIVLGWGAIAKGTIDLIDESVDR